MHPHTLEPEKGLFRGLHPEDLPAYAQERLKNFFSLASKDYSEQKKLGKEPDWCILISTGGRCSGAPCEWTEFQADHGMPFLFEPEIYGYFDGKANYRIEIINSNSKERELVRSLNYFDFLKLDSKEFVRNAEDMDCMASYTIYRGYKYI